MSKNKFGNSKFYSLHHLSSNSSNKPAEKKGKYFVTKEIFDHGPEKKIPFNLVRSRRRKTSELIIENETEITVRVPFDKPMEEIKEIIQRKIQWIFKKQEEYKRIKPEINQFSYLPYSTLPYLGNNYEIEIRNLDSFKDKAEKIFLEDDRFFFYLKDVSIENNQDNQLRLSASIGIDGKIIKNKIKMLYDKWLQDQAQIVFKKKIYDFSKIIGVNPKDWKIKKLKNRWGSVTKKGTINLNVNLIKAPNDIVDYVIRHELCHFKIEGHSHHFWKFLKQFEPAYEKKIKWLSINGKNILET